MKKLKTKGAVGAFNPSKPIIIRQVSPEEAAKCTELIGYSGWDTRDQVELPHNDSIILFGSLQLFTSITEGLGITARVNARPRTVAEIHKGLQDGLNYLLLSASDGHFGELRNTPEVIKYFGSNIDPYYMSPGILRLRNTAAAGKDVSHKNEVQLLGLFPSDRN